AVGQEEQPWLVNSSRTETACCPPTGAADASPIARTGRERIRNAVSQRVIVILERFRAKLIRASASKCQSRMGELHAYVQVEVEGPAESRPFPVQAAAARLRSTYCRMPPWR